MQVIKTGFNAWGEKKVLILFSTFFLPLQV